MKTRIPYRITKFPTRSAVELPTQWQTIDAMRQVAERYRGLQRFTADPKARADFASIAEEYEQRVYLAEAGMQP